MKLIDVGICVENIDPRGIGRIRCKSYSEFTSAKENAVKYEKWGIDDPFVLQPFLPLNINVIPQIGQAVKILSYNLDNSILDREYIAGPFSNSHDFLNQTYTKQLENTTYGVAVKKTPDLFNENGKYINPKFEASLANKNDFGLYGKYGSDIVFTENGVNIRGGKLVDKDHASESQLNSLINHPVMSNKFASISLKKFPKKATLESKLEYKYVGENKNLNYLIEYTIESFETPIIVKFFVYKIQKVYGDKTKTNIFDLYTELPESIIKLINVENDDITATHQVIVNNINDAYIEINNFISSLHEKSLNKFNTLYSEENLHPFYYRPTKELIEYVPVDEIEKKSKITLLNNIQPYGKLPTQNALIWSKERITPKVQEIPKQIPYVKQHKNSPEQTFATIKSDKIYFMSTDSNESDKNINFSILNKYEFTQEDYINNIEKNTYSTVRGENLLNILKQMMIVLFDHRHNLTKPMAKEGYDDYHKLVEMIKNMENDILNKSIKIN
jgi:hypothetical protein